MAVFSEFAINGWDRFYTPVIPSTQNDIIVHSSQYGVGAYYYSGSTYSGGTSSSYAQAIYLSSTNNLTFSQSAAGQYAMTGGDVTAIQYSFSGSSRFETYSNGLNISDTHYNATTIQSFIDTYNNDGLWRYLVAGSDTFYIADNPDTFRYYRPTELVYAGTGNDTIYVSGVADRILIGGLDSNAIFSGGGNDLIWAGEKDAAALSTADWSTADGGAGNDYIYAGNGSNTVLSGNSGNDFIYDGLGTDILDGGAGNDYFSASHGYNIFRFGADSNVAGNADVILDFNSDPTNYIQLSAAVHPFTYVGGYAGGTYIYIAGGEIIYVVGVSVADVYNHLYYV